MNDNDSYKYDNKLGKSINQNIIVNGIIIQHINNTEMHNKKHGEKNEYMTISKL